MVQVIFWPDNLALLSYIVFLRRIRLLVWAISVFDKLYYCREPLGYHPLASSNRMELWNGGITPI
jgi:hypothetical protein